MINCKYDGYRTASETMIQLSQLKPFVLSIRVAHRLRTMKRRHVMMKLITAVTAAAASSACQSLFQLEGHVGSMVDR